MVKLWRENLAKVNQKVSPVVEVIVYQKQYCCSKSCFLKKNQEKLFASVSMVESYLCILFLTMTPCTKSSLQAAESLADPTEYENLFPGLKEAFAAEYYLRETCLGTSRPATDYPLVTVSCMT